ncbi:MAG: hypothetical protein JNM24_04425 [Bdellovibrionaceae bacterium]|nr:hypothetical protein [Pseudobdellovibrionaceae bacterium]
MKSLLTSFVLIFVSVSFAQEISTVEISPNRSSKTQNETSSSEFSSSNNKSYYQSVYNSNWEMRDHRKLGAGIGLAGVFGQIGGVADINFDAQNAAQVGFGNGYGFSTFFAGWKTSFESQFLSPYITVGYSRWYNSDNVDLRGNSYILDQVLSKNELRSGKIGVDFLLANVGVQYNQLDSEWIGNSFFLEFNFLYSTSRGTLLPAASIGSIYYF